MTNSDEDRMRNSHVKYDNHQNEWDACVNDPEKNKVAVTWIEQKDTVDCWRHDRMYNLVKPFIDFDSESTWLTVGDGRYGTDGHALMNMGVKDVHCSDISDTLLKIGNAEGFIGDYSAQNAEALQFSDNQFDYVLCKEAFHHFPRPFVALDEMFRVANIAVIIIEPRDILIDKGAFSWALNIIKYIFNKPINSHNFEPVGNYIYSVSERELEKFLLGMHKRFIAFNGINDAYEEGVEFVEFSTANRSQRKLIKKIRLKIRLGDFLNLLGVRKSGIIAAVLFKTEPLDHLKGKLSRSGWQLKELPKNPYI